MPDGRTKRKTIIGVFMTLLLVAILITFIVYRLNDMRQGPVVIESMQLDFFDIDNIFRSDEESFRFAFGLTDFDNGREVDMDEQALYGTMKAKQVSWGLAGQEPGFYYNDLQSKPCTTENLGLEQGKEANSLFYPPHERSSSALLRYSSRFNCIDDVYELSGDIDAERGRTLQFELELAEPCAANATNTSGCKT